MKLLSGPSLLSGSVNIPGSKSHTIRALVFGLLAGGESRISAPLFSADTLSCIEGCKALGADIRILEENPVQVVIRGVGGKPNPSKTHIDMGNSGTSLRLLSGVASLCNKPLTFDGDDSLRTRLMGPLLEALKNLGAEEAYSHQKNGKCPLTLKGPVCGGETEIEGITSQFLSSLLITLPVAEKDSVLRAKNLHEKPYVEITLTWLKKLGIEVTHENMEIFRIKGQQRYPAFQRRIPADFSTACFPLCAAAVTRSKVSIQGLDFSDTQGDKAVFDYFKKMGMSLTEENGETVVDGSKTILQGIEIDMNATPDALPVMAVAGCFAKGKTILKNVAQARIKECDRIAAMTKELCKMGAVIEEFPDGMIIHESALKGTELSGYNDHRIVMALAIAGLGAEGRTSVDTAESAAVTYPDFIKDMKALGAKFETR